MDGIIAKPADARWSAGDVYTRILKCFLSFFHPFRASRLECVRFKRHVRKSAYPEVGLDNQALHAIYS